MIFVLTKNLHCLLIAFNKDLQKVELISKGFLQEKSQVARDAPYPLYLSNNKKFITMMLYENVIKIIPIVKNQGTKI